MNYRLDALFKLVLVRLFQLSSFMASKSTAKSSATGLEIFPRLGSPYAMIVNSASNKDSYRHAIAI